MAEEIHRYKIPDEAMRQLLLLKEKRPLTRDETLFRAGLALGLTVPKGYVLDDESGEFLSPKTAEEIKKKPVAAADTKPNED